MPIKTTVRYHFISIRMATSKENKKSLKALVRMWKNWNPYALLIGG